MMRSRLDSKFERIPSKQRKRHAARGVTLFEVLIVVAIMAMIATTVGIAVLNESEKAKRRHALTNATEIRSAVKLWWSDHDDGECPDVKRLVDDGTLERNNANKQDPWGGSWHLQCEGNEVTVISHGRDHTANTEDDIRAPPI